ncbi:hypothetical protein [Nocardia sp. alder85J]|uniref:hypothetical protein n=1 Tax=Nocardia sp. alder85J TaxID=2862949 RepID=UPI001CD3AC7C|nr:hypothetical protein [Nocardia sp. alder85J]MCX4095124.1 hypothetical protein [Nocardia sp. alder85J]
MIDTPRREQPGDAPLPERADLTAWRRRHALRRSSAAQPVPNARRYRRTTKHRKHEQDS